MFYERDLLKFKNFIIQYGGVASLENIYQHRYVFLEDHNQLCTLHGIPIQQQTFANATGKSISIWTTKKSMYPNMVIIDALRSLIQFKSVLEFKQTDPFIVSTFLGLTDMNLIPRSSATSSDSVAPTIKTSDVIYITDLTMKSLPTYFLDQFVTTVWISFLASFTLCGLLLYVSNLCFKRFATRPTNNFNWFSIITQQGGSESSGFISRNMILLTLGLLTIIFYGFFEAFLSSSLAIRVPDIPFSDLNGLLNAKDYTICTIPTSPANLYMKNMHQMKAQHNSEECPKYFREFSIITKSSRANLSQCPDGKFAYMGFGTHWNVEWNAKCKLVPLAEKYFTNYISITVSPGFKYREHFNKGILKFRTGGHIQHLMTIHARQAYFKIGAKNGRYKDFDKRENIVQSVDLRQVTIILIILIAGIFCSMLVLLSEILIRFGTNSI